MVTFFRLIEIKVAIWNLTTEGGNLFQANEAHGSFLAKIIRIIWAKIWYAAICNHHNRFYYELVW